VAFGATATGAVGKEKAIDTAMAGFKSKSADTPNPFDAAQDAYRKTAESVSRSLFVGEVRLPSKALGDFAGRLRAFGDQSAAKAGFYATLRETGTVSVFPSFASPKDRTKQHDLSKGVRTIVSKIAGGVFTSRLAHLWEEEPQFRQRMSFLRSLKSTIDTAHVVQPLLSP